MGFSSNISFTAMIWPLLFFTFFSLRRKYQNFERARTASVLHLRGAGRQASQALATRLRCSAAPRSAGGRQSRARGAAVSGCGDAQPARRERTASCDTLSALGAPPSAGGGQPPGTGGASAERPWLHRGPQSGGETVYLFLCARTQHARAVHVTRTSRRARSWVCSSRVRRKAVAYRTPHSICRLKPSSQAAGYTTSTHR